MRLTQPVGPFSSIKFLHDVETQQLSNCSFSEIEVYGYLSPDLVITDVNHYTPALSYFLTDTLSYNTTVTFDWSATPKVQTVTPRHGSWKVSNTLNINGEFGTHFVATVIVDGVDCVVSSSTASAVICVLPAQPNEMVNSPGDFEVRVDGRKAYLSDGAKFQFVSLWTDPETWGNNSPGVVPTTNSNVFIPLGKRVFVNVMNLTLGVVTIEGTLIIDEPTAALTFSLDTMFINRGSFIVSSPAVSFTPLEFPINVHLIGKRMATRNSKAIICNSCNLLIYGNPVAKRYLTNAVTTGSNTIQFEAESSPWNVGDTILVGPSQHNYEQIDMKVIQSQSTSGSLTTITVT